MAGVGAQQPPVSEWPSYLHGVARSGYNPGEVAARPPLRESWRREDAGLSDLTAPVVGDGIVYLSSTLESTRSTVLALDLESGAVIWQSTVTGTTWSASPALAGGTLYVVSAEASVGGYLHAFDSGTGALRWRKTIPETTEGDPVVYGGTIFLTSAAGRVYAINGTTQETAWIYTPTAATIAGDPILVDGILVLFNGSSLVALDPASGQELWVQPHNLQTWFWDLVGNEAEGLLYVVSALPGSPLSLEALDARTGMLVWSHPYPAGSWSQVQPVLAEGVLYHLVQAWPDSYLVSLDARTGDLLSEFTVPYVNGNYTFLTMANGVLYAVTNQWYQYPLVFAFDAAGGGLLWQSPETHASTSPVVVADGRVLVLYVPAPGTDPIGLVVYENEPVALADLVAGSIELSAPPAAGVPNQASLILQNLGSLDSGSFDFRWTLDGTPFLSTHPSLAPQESARLTFDWTPAAGTHILRFDADVADQVPEINELNNAAEIRVEVPGASAPSLRIQLSTGAVSRNDTTGWYDDNPLTVEAVLDCPASVPECSGLFSLDVSSPGKARFYVYDPHGGTGDALCSPEVTGGLYSFETLQVTCARGEIQTFRLSPGETVTLRWSLWIQPSEATSLDFAATWGVLGDTAALTIDAAEIHPLVFIHGILGSMAPQDLLIRDRSKMRSVLDPFLGSYRPLLVNLEKMGYEWDRTLFALAYDWRQSNKVSGGFLGRSLAGTVIPNSNGVAYVARDGKADIVAHSMGGLVSRAYIQGRALDPRSGDPLSYQDDVRKVVFIASPHKGFPFDYRTWEGGTWSDYLYNAPLLSGSRFLLPQLMDRYIWPTLVAKRYGASALELGLSPLCQVVPVPPTLLPAKVYILADDLPVLFECEPAIVHAFSHHPDPARGVRSLPEMLPTEDVPLPYLARGGTHWPYGHEVNAFLTSMNADIAELTSALGLSNIFLIYGNGAEETDIQYQVSAPPSIGWTYGRPFHLVELPLGDDLIPVESASMGGVLSVPPAQRAELDASLPASAGGARHKEIAYHPETQATWVPRFLAGVELPFATPYIPAVANIPKLVSVILSCPADVLVIDPTGRRLGFDPDSGEVVEEIPNSVYTGAGVEPQILLIGDVVPGDYRIVVTGFGSGPYHVRVDLGGEGGMAPWISLVGEITAGERDTFEISVPENAPPVGVADDYETKEGEALVVAAPGVLSNDIDPEGKSLTARLLEEPANGTLSLQLDGSFSYVPFSGFRGTDRFIYEAGDGESSSAPTTVIVTVVPVENRPPVAVPDVYSIGADCVLAVDVPGVLGNDLDPDGQELTVQVETDPMKGRLELSGNGSFRYTAFRRVEGSDRFTYRASDGMLVSEPAAVTILLGSACHPPRVEPGTHFRSIGTHGGVLAREGTISVEAGSTLVRFSGASLPSLVGPGDRLLVNPGERDEEILYIASLSASSPGSDSALVRVEKAPSKSQVGVPFLVHRAFTTIQDWEDERQGDLVSQRRLEIGVLYNDGPFTRPAAYALATLDGSLTDRRYFLWLTAAPGHRHNGIAGGGVVLDGEDEVKLGIRVRDDFTRIDGIELKRFRSDHGAAGIDVKSARNVVVDGLLVHDFDSSRFSTFGIKGSEDSDFSVRNSMVFDGDDAGIRSNHPTSRILIENCTIYGMSGYGVDERRGRLRAINTAALGNRKGDFRVPQESQRHNLSSDGTATGAGSIQYAVPAEELVSILPGAEDLHLRETAQAIDAGQGRSRRFAHDIDLEPRPQGAGWDIGADELTGSVGRARRPPSGRSSR